MNYSLICLGLAVLFALLAVGSYLLAVQRLRQKNVPTPFFFLNIFLPKYLRLYREQTKREYGRVGAPFYCWLVFINLALLAFLLYILLRILAR